MQRIHEEVHAAIKASNKIYVENADQWRMFKEFFEANQVQVDLERRGFPKELTISSSMEKLDHARF